MQRWEKRTEYLYTCNQVYILLYIALSLRTANRLEWVSCKLEQPRIRDPYLTAYVIETLENIKLWGDHVRSTDFEDMVLPHNLLAFQIYKYKITLSIQIVGFLVKGLFVWYIIFEQKIYIFALDSDNKINLSKHLC